MRLICVPLTDDRRHEEAIKDFVIDREAGIPKNLDYVAGLEAYLKRCAWDDDMNHDVKIYLIKDLEMEGEIVAYFGLRAGSVIDRSKGIFSMQEVEEALNNQNVKLVPATHPGIEISHFAVNDNYRRKVGNIKGLGEYLYPEFIFPIILDVFDKIGVRLIYLFAAGDEHLIRYYRRVFRFQNLDANDTNTPILPSYDKGCTFMYDWIVHG